MKLPIREFVEGPAVTRTCRGCVVTANYFEVKLYYFDVKLYAGSTISMKMPSANPVRPVRLERRGLVTREAHAVDRRRIAITESVLTQLAGLLLDGTAGGSE